MTIMAADPSSSDTGMTARLFCPHRMRSVARASRPKSRPGRTSKRTEAVMTVEAMMRMARMRETFTPAERASSSERERILSRQAQCHDDDDARDDEGGNLKDLVVGDRGE